MKYRKLLEIVQDEPVFESGLLLSGDVDPALLHQQLSRWTRAGRLIQVRRGLYTLAPPFRKVDPHPFLIANHLMRSSYVSCQSALAWFGLIPESVPVITSVSTIRPHRWDTPVGSFIFRHIRTGLFTGYRRLEVTTSQAAYLATPEKALLDLVYLQPGGDSREFLHELRLQNLEQLDLDRLNTLARELQSPKLERAAGIIEELATEEIGTWETIERIGE